MQSKATTVEQYLDELPEDRQPAISEVRNVILKNIPKGYEEVMNWGMITYEVPLSIFPNTYNKKPLVYAALASQKNHMAVYLSGVYINEKLRLQFENDYKATGKRLDMGKSCVRFKKLENLPLELIGKAIANFEVDEFIEVYNNGRNSREGC